MSSERSGGRRSRRRDMDYSRVPAYPKKSAAKHGTAISMETLKKVADAYTTFPAGFTVHPKVMPQLQRRAAAITQGPIDWATAEIVAFGSLLLDGPYGPSHRAGHPARHLRAAVCLHR